MNKSTAIAPSNIAFIKYWGKKDEVLRLPDNGSISMNLSGLTTTTTVEFIPTLSQDQVYIDKYTVENEIERVSKFLDLVRTVAGISERAKIVSKNNFPSSTGLSSSASGFAALTLATVTAAGLELTEKELSILARQGSGSACRSIPDGFTEWLNGETSETSYAVSLYPVDYWDIADVVAIVSTAKKDVPTSAGQKLIHTSPFYQTRFAGMDEKLKLAKSYLDKRDFTALGELIEAETLNMHAVMMTSYPPLLYLTPASLLLIKEIVSWRKSGLEAYFTVNTGQDIHIICWQKDTAKVETKLKSYGIVRDIIVNRPANGARLVPSHLF
jgi:diphosphomevalonate decarboxylase